MRKTVCTFVSVLARALAAKKSTNHVIRQKAGERRRGSGLIPCMKFLRAYPIIRGPRGAHDGWRPGARRTAASARFRKVILVTLWKSESPLQRNSKAR